MSHSKHKYDAKYPLKSNLNNSVTIMSYIEPCHEKTRFLHMRKQRRRSASR